MTKQEILDSVKYDENGLVKFVLLTILEKNR